MLCGCGAQETIETISDKIESVEQAKLRRISMILPEEAALPTLESDEGAYYQCGAYDIYVQTVQGGDLYATIEKLTGFHADKLTILKTEQGDVSCSEFVWATSAENGEQIGHAMVLDDGNYHYCISVLADAETARENVDVWKTLFQSVSLSE